MRLEANPEYYDYIHFIDFKKNNECVFIDGAGQSICLESKGYYKFHYNYPKNGGYIYFEIENKKFEVEFTIENKTFILMKEIIWNCEIEDWPFLIFSQRFVFKSDPFEGLYKNRDTNLYFLLEKNRETKDNMRCFYNSNRMVEKSLNKLNKLELKIVKNKYPQFNIL